MLCCPQEARGLAVQVRTLIPLIGELEHDVATFTRREASVAAQVAEMAAAVEELRPVEEHVASLGAKMLVPMRGIELEATATALRDSQLLAAANASAAKMQEQAREHARSAEAAWRKERDALAASRDASAEQARTSVAEAATLRSQLAGPTSSGRRRTPRVGW